MNKNTLIMTIFLVTTTLSIGQNSNEKVEEERKIGVNSSWLGKWCHLDVDKTNTLTHTKVLSGTISSDTQLNKKNIYLLKGNVFVTNNATLKIQAGTIILADHKTKASLTITKGARILAKGTPVEPILFTSNKSDKKAGDWNGISILGEASVNSRNHSIAKYYSNLNNEDFANLIYGGDKDDSSSGVFKFVRVEFAGKQISKDLFSSSILLAGIGSKTVISGVLVTNCAGNSFEIIGGKSKLSKLISHNCRGTDYKFNNGADCLLSNSIAARSPFISNNLGSKCIELRSYDKKENYNPTEKISKLKARNLTLVNISRGIEEKAKMGLIKEAIEVGDNTSFNIYDSVISGFSPAILFNEAVTTDSKGIKNYKITKMLFNNCIDYFAFKKGGDNKSLTKRFTKSEAFNTFNNALLGETFVDIYNKSIPNFDLK